MSQAVRKKRPAPCAVAPRTKLSLCNAGVAERRTSVLEVTLGAASIRVLVVDDYEPWHRVISTTLRKEPKLQIIGYASDGLEAVQHAERLQPDLILMDIGLPILNGIEAAGRIREVSPRSKILFVSQNHSPEIVQEALSNGVGGYVVKSHAGSELLPAIKAILEGKRFISASLTALLVATAFSTITQTIVSSVIASILGVL